MDLDYTKDNQWIAAHLGDDYGRFLNSVVPPVFMNSLHVFDDIESYCHRDELPPDKYFYGRGKNPTVEVIEQKIAAMEHGKAGVAFSSGMAASAASILAICRPGDHIIAARNCYIEGFIQHFFCDRYNMSCTFVGGTDPQEFEDAIQPNTKLICMETPLSLVFSLQDIRGVVAIAKKHGIKTYIDNSYCTPIFQTPLDMGVDLVMHTASKYIGGHSDIIGGLLVTSDEELLKEIRMIRGSFGSIIGPMEGWLMLRGVRTLEPRLERHQETALAVAHYLEKNEHVSVVHYAGLESHPQYELMKSQQTGNCGLMSFEIDTQNDEDVYNFVRNLNVFQIGVSWGGFESLVCTPFMNGTLENAQKQGAKSRMLVRIHCGLEGADNLIDDLDNAFKHM